MHTPYTYRVKFTPTGQYYYGVRYSKACHPADLWVSYFTSSKNVKKLIKENGIESFTIEIRKTFNNKEHAIAWEEKVTRRVIHWPNYLNANSAGAFNHSKSVNGGVRTVELGTGIHSMTREQKSAAGRKGGLALGKRKKETGLTKNEKLGIIEGRRKISVRRKLGNLTDKEKAALADTTLRRNNGDWTENETAAYAKLTERRKAAEWTTEELAGFNKVSNHRKSGRWITDGKCNKFTTEDCAPLDWIFGFTRKKKGA
jgi:hypothetical protein